MSHLTNRLELRRKTDMVLKEIRTIFNETKGDEYSQDYGYLWKGIRDILDDVASRDMRAKPNAIKTALDNAILLGIPTASLGKLLLRKLKEAYVNGPVHFSKCFNTILWALDLASMNAFNTNPDELYNLVNCHLATNLLKQTIRDNYKHSVIPPHSTPQSDHPKPLDFNQFMAELKARMVKSTENADSHPDAK